MRIATWGRCLLGAMFLTATLTAYGQAASETKDAPTALEVSLTYTPLLANVSTGSSFTMQGGSMQVHGRFWPGLGTVADVTGLLIAAMNSSGAGLDLVTTTFGPRYTLARSPFQVFGQALAGQAYGMNSAFPSTQRVNSSANSLAIELGGGVNRDFSKHLSLRLAEVDWLRTQLPNATTNVQNNISSPPDWCFAQDRVGSRSQVVRPEPRACMMRT